MLSNLYSIDRFKQRYAYVIYVCSFLSILTQEILDLSKFKITENKYSLISQLFGLLYTFGACLNGPASHYLCSMQKDSKTNSHCRWCLLRMRNKIIKTGAPICNTLSFCTILSNKVVHF